MKLILTLTSLAYTFYCNAQNIGIGEPNPTEKLQLATGNIKLGNSDKGILLNGAASPMITRALDTFTTGSYPGMGRWGMFLYNNNISIGMPNLAGKSFSVTKLDLNGRTTPVLEVKTNGAIEVNGKAGTAGQVLTSNEAGVAEWRSGSLPQIRLGTSFSNLSSGELLFAQTYKYLQGDIQYFRDSIIFPTGGLYQFDVFLWRRLTLNSAPNYRPFLELEMRSYTGTTYKTYPIISGNMEPNVNGGTAPATDFAIERKVSFAVYIPAGNYIKLNLDQSVTNINGVFGNTGFSCYLLSE